MPRYLRPRAPGATIHFKVCLAEQGSTLLIDEINTLRAAVGLTRRTRPFHVDAWVVLPDHMLCIWTLPENDHDFSTRWRQIKTRFSRSLPRKTRTASQLAQNERGIWQRRYSEHHIRDTRDFQQHMRHCYDAPANLGLVKRSSDWPYSSFYLDRVGRVLARTATETADFKASGDHPTRH